jgi:hypothetical protein
MSFADAEAFEIAYYRQMTPVERIETIQYLRELFLKINPQFGYGKSRKRLRRSVTIIQ